MQALLAKATDLVNENMIDQIAKKVEQIDVNKNCKIAILGLAYKPDTDVAEESAGVKIANLLSRKSAKVYVWDPKAMSKVQDLLSQKVKIAKSLKECIKDSDLIVITTPWDQFRHIKPSDLVSSIKKPVLLDCWRMLDPLKYQKVAVYRTIGQESLKLA